MRRELARWVAMLFAVLGLACAAPEPPDTPVARVSARTADLALLLERLAQLEGTPLGRRSAALAAALPSCAVVEARADDADLDALLDSLRCATERDELASARAGRDIGFVWPLGSGKALRGRLDLDAWGGAELELLVPPGVATGAAAMILPGEEAPGPGVFSRSDTLLHARVRPAGGLGLAALVAIDSQASQLFRLQSAMIAGTVLDGTWEAAIYLPAAADELPPAALAVGFHARAPAVAAMERFVSELRDTWSIARSDFRIGDASGACLPDLRILPGFAPCYVATEGALVLGWNAASLVRALETSGDRFGPQGGLLIELARFGEADAAIARLPAPAAAAPVPWKRIRAVGRQESDGVRLHFHLQAEPDA